MIVRTYGRRTRTMYSDDSSLNDVVEDPISFSQQEIEDTPEEINNFTFSSQDSTRWTFDSEPYFPNSSQNSLQLIAPIDNRRKSKKLRSGGRRESGREWAVTTSLMETQECGEMMEHEDEVNFALDGLRKGQPVRIRRASLLSLMEICGTAQQRRLIRAQGIAKTIIDAILGLCLDDSPSNLAAAALFYVLIADVQDDYLLDSPSSIHFLLKLLKPTVSDTVVDKSLALGHKLLALWKDTHNSQDTAKRLDSSTATISNKVQEILLTCKNLKTSNEYDDETLRRDLSPKWIALLTMEKACLSTISIEDTTGAVRKTGGNFKERLRELGGLDAVFELALNLHRTIEDWLEQSSAPKKSKVEDDLQCLALLLKCLKIMENATFLSKENQSHLLGMKRTNKGSSWSFTKLMINFIKVLSGLSFLRRSSSSSSPEVRTNLSNVIDHSPEFMFSAEENVNSNGLFTMRSSQECSTTGRISLETDLNKSRTSQRLSSSSSSHFISFPSSSEATTRSMAENCLIKMRVSSMSDSCSLRSKSSDGGKKHCVGDEFLNLEDSEDPFAFVDDEFEPSNTRHLTGNSPKKTGFSSSLSSSCSLKRLSGGIPMLDDDSRMGFSRVKRPYDNQGLEFEDLDEREDPFAFDEDEFEPSKWDTLYGRQNVSQTRKGGRNVKDDENRCLALAMPSQEEFVNEENHNSNETSCSTASDEGCSNLLADCLLTTVKVLMNLTNDNAIGCQQIAACGGLETLSALIASHFPSFSSSLSPAINTKNTLFSNSIAEVGSQTEPNLSDQERDFLVAILGLLVNLVEKDSNNRSRLAAASVSLPSLRGLKDGNSGVIPLLCSVFLANRGAGEAYEEGNVESLDDEAVLLQGEKEAEKMIVEAYAALLLAFLSTESKSIRDAIANCLPDRSLSVLVPVLERFVAFHLTLNMISPETHKTVSEVIESCRVP